jgi:excisionase family DNA binding protein
MTEITILTERINNLEALVLKSYKLINNLEALILKSYISQKNVLTLEETAFYTGRSLSNLYKLTSSGAIPGAKPEGKILYFSRTHLEEWMLRNPIRTQASIEVEAATYVAKKRGRKGGW